MRSPHLLALGNVDDRCPKIGGLTDQELIVHAIREVTLIAWAAIEPGDRRYLVTRLLAVLDRGDGVLPGIGWRAIRHATAAGGLGLMFLAQGHNELRSSGTSPNFLITLASLKLPVAGSAVRLKP
ncbi:hypothetical protein [Bradyrhizobium lablabi]|uniref:hypothetical protein n=1 Tax=Bradyrhizobium lablabi TaxID=722472 RepID=UPI0012ABD391|nr:hypothetical protein [Bradyrhizobium lablabi]